MVSLDEDKCLQLSQILRAFNAALNEEQCWAICHQSIQCFSNFFDNNYSLIISDPKYLFLTKDGYIHQKSLFQDSENRLKCFTKNKLLSSLGVILFKALDFGLCEEEERSLSHPLELLIESLIQSDPDEGIERDCDHCFEDIIEKCISRLSIRESAQSHYRAVCRALVAETLELTQFLDQISRGSQVKEESLELIEFHDWAKLWVQVIRQLRNGVKLRKVDHPTLSGSIEYELTPFEMLLDDIRLKRYKLNKIMENNGNIPQRVKKDAHQLILDFIRSRPPLHPVSQRQLKPLPEKNQTLYERLMQSIREGNKLRPTRSQHSLESNVNQIEKEQSLSLSPAPRRRLIKADLNLSLSSNFDDEEEEEVLNKEESQKRKFSLRNLLERRHSITVCESPDNSEDTRHHVANIWQSTDWGHALQCLSLTLEEVKHIRSVLTKAELETLAVTKELRVDLEGGRICFTCLKTRFSFFQRPNICKVCERHICDRCATRMHIPCETFEKVPIYMLSPSPSPPEDNKSRDWSQQSSQMESRKRSPLMRLMTRDSDCIVVDSGLRKSGPLVRVCRDCKILVRHLIDMGSVGSSY